MPYILACNINLRRYLCNRRKAPKQDADAARTYSKAYRHGLGAFARKPPAKAGHIKQKPNSSTCGVAPINTSLRVKRRKPRRYDVQSRYARTLRTEY